MDIFGGLTTKMGFLDFLEKDMLVSILELILIPKKQ